MNEDIRWKQRFNNFTRALKQLKLGIEIMQQRVLSIIEEQGVIQAFEYNHELAWNVLKDYLEYQGITGIIGSRDATREAFKGGLIENGEIWMDMIKSRNLSTHTYNEDTAQKLIKVIPIYYQEFLKLQVIMNGFLEKTDL
jgi:nucleotidyltransferase substrate binding protein (TIGR01987 family)